MKKYLILALFCLFGLLYTQIVYGTPAPILPTYYQDSCSMMTNVNSSDGYKLVLISGFSGYIEEVKPFTCLKGYIFLVPEDLDIDSIKTIEWSDDERNKYPGHFKTYFDPGWKDYYRSFGEKFVRALENGDSKLVGRLDGVNSKYGRQFKFSHSLDLYKLAIQDDGEYWLVRYNYIGYENYYIYYVIGGIIVLGGIVWLVRKKIKSKKTK